jgi:hypothetical protein
LAYVNMVVIPGLPSAIDAIWVRVVRQPPVAAREAWPMQSSSTSTATHADAWFPVISGWDIADMQRIVATPLFHLVDL